MCDDDECPEITPGEITPTPLPEQAGGVVIVSTLPNIDDAREGIIYLYLTDESDASTFSGAYVADKKIGQLINISDEGGSSVNVVQTTGASTTDVMSQNAVTTIIGDIETALHTINVGTGA